MHAYVQGSDEWLEMRRNAVGASDAPVIMGVSPWKTPHMLWEEKLGLREAQKTNAAMERGNELEEPARREFARLTGLIMVPEVTQHPEYDWMVASLDGICKDRKNIVEIKCPGQQDHLTAIGNEIPAKYYPQLQHQMAVTGLGMAYYFSFDGKKGVIVKVERDQKYIDSLISNELEFWRCVQNFEPPKLTERDYITKDDALWRDTSASWLDLQAQIEKLVEKQETLREELIRLGGGCNCLGSGIRLQRVTRKGNVDYRAIPQLREVNLEEYRKQPVESWRITQNE